MHIAKNEFKPQAYLNGIHSSPKKKRLIIQTLNSIGPTSMPFNDFALYRIQKYSDESHLVISWGKSNLDKDEIHKYFSKKSRSILFCSCNIVSIVALLIKTVREYQDMNYVVLFHLHHPASGFMGCLLRAIMFRKIKIVYTIHSSFKHYSLKNKILTALNFMFSDYSVFVSKSSFEAFPEKLLEQKADQVKVICNGVDIEQINKEIESANDLQGRRIHSLKFSRTFSKKSFRLIAVSRLIALKNHRLLICALQKLPEDIKLIIVGAGGLEDELRQLTDVMGCRSRVLFTGMVARKEVYKIMKACDVFVSPSYWEGLPIAVLEAMVVGIPIILSDIGPHREIAKKSSGISILPIDQKAWIDEVSRLYSLPNDEITSIGTINRERAFQHFSLNTMHAEYSELYSQLTY